MTDAPNRIREIRDSKGITIERLSDLTGLSVSHLSRMERGARNLSVENLTIIAAALGVPKQDILVKPDESDEIDRIVCALRATPEPLRKSIIDSLKFALKIP